MAAAVGIRSSPSGTQPGYEHALLSVTEVIFTCLLCSSSIQFVRGSSGGGLPRRPEQCSGRFFTLGEDPLFRPKTELPRFTLLATFPPESHPISGATIS